MKIYDVIIDMTDSFICPIEAKSKKEALSKAEKISNPQYYDVPHYTKTEVIGIFEEKTNE
jgi:hypothetical protein